MLAARTLFSLLLLAISQVVAAQTATVATRFERGTLLQGQPKGVWEYFEDDDQLVLRMNYDSSRISYHRPDTARYELLIGETWRLAYPSRPPMLLGSRAQRRATLNKEIRYPAAALQGQRQGDVLLSYVVQPTGHTSEYTVVSSPSAACTQEVWRVLRALPDRWIPAVYLGQARAARFYLRVRFEMVEAASIAAGQGHLSPPLPSGPFTDAVVVTAVAIEQGRRIEHR